MALVILSICRASECSTMAFVEPYHFPPRERLVGPSDRPVAALARSSVQQQPVRRLLDDGGASASDRMSLNLMNMRVQAGDGDGDGYDFNPPSLPAAILPSRASELQRYTQRPRSRSPHSPSRLFMSSSETSYKPIQWIINTLTAPFWKAWRLLSKIIVTTPDESLGEDNAPSIAPHDSSFGDLKAITMDPQQLELDETHATSTLPTTVSNPSSHHHVPTIAAPSLKQRQNINVMQSSMAPAVSIGVAEEKEEREGTVLVQSKLSPNVSHTDTAHLPTQLTPVQQVPITNQASTVHTPTKLTGERWAIPDPNIDLSGNWRIVVTKEFKKEYDRYLAKLGQPVIVRSVAINIVDRTVEEIEQKHGGREFSIRGENLRGIWDRTLISSGADFGDDGQVVECGEHHLRTVISTADNEKVESEAWWGSDGTVHHSWLLGITRYGGGDFEARRYFVNGGKSLICESTFHFKSKTKDKAKITWNFVREDV